jgi:hypothetical protein
MAKKGREMGTWPLDAIEVRPAEMFNKIIQSLNVEAFSSTRFGIR